MVTAYIMVKANASDADRIKEDILSLDGVETVNIVAGDVDFIARVRVDSPADVKDIAASGIQAIEGIEDTQTYIAMD